MFAFLPVLFWMGIRQPAAIAPIFALLGGAGACSLIAARSRRPRTSMVVAALFASTLAFAFVGRLFGTLVLVPASVAVNATAYAIFLDRRWRPLVMALSALAIGAPLALELLGALSPSYAFTAAGMTIVPTAIELPRAPVLVFLTVANILAVALGAMVVGHIRDRLAEAEHRIYVYAWHLRELVPASARPTTDPTAR